MHFSVASAAVLPLATPLPPCLQPCVCSLFYFLLFFTFLEFYAKTIYYTFARDASRAHSSTNTVATSSTSSCSMAARTYRLMPRGCHRGTVAAPPGCRQAATMKMCAIACDTLKILHFIRMPLSSKIDCACRLLAESGTARGTGHSGYAVQHYATL